MLDGRSREVLGVRRIAFTSNRDGPHDLYVLEIASGTVARLTTNLSVRSQASWTRDGTRIAFSAFGSGVDEIYVIGADGRGLTRLTRGADGLRQ